MSGAPAKATVKSGESPPVQGSEGGSKRRGALWLIGLGLLAALLAYLLQLRLFQSSVHLSAVETDGFSRNVSTCPGYVLSDIQTSPAGLSARLDLAGSPCDAYGYDVKQLVVDVTYETSTRLRVSIADAESRHYRLPAEYFPRPSLTPDSIGTVESELQFHYESSPFAFWITRAEDADVLFDTRLSSLPKAPTRDADGNLLDGFGLVFEDQYLQLTSALPRDANIYGLGEAVASAGLRRATGVGGKSTIQTMWARDEADPVDENMYGVHPVYLDHRIASSGARTHAIFMSPSAGADVVLTTPPSSSLSSPSLIQFRLISGIIDLYIFAGPTPLAAIEQYGALVGTPAWVPYWAFGFHLLRWGYQSVGETKEVVERMREADIPLEVMWNDIDLYHDLRDFTADPVRFPPKDVRTFIRELKSKGQYFIPILDAGIPHIANDTDDYLPFLTGLELDLFIKNPDGSLYIGQVWPGYTVFPDWLHPSVESWWADALRNWTELGVEYSGIWLDMNEPVSFCTGSCGSGADLSNTSQPILFPGDAEDPIVAWPEGYDPTEWGTSGNISVGGKLTFGGADKTGVDFSWGVAEPPHVRSYPGEPPYAIHNGHGALAVKSVATNATHIGELTELEVHNLFGYLEERATHRALLANRPSERPFIISRSTFPSSGHWTGHWLGDNHSKWSYLRYNIQGVLQFQIFQIPMVGADICGFNGNTNEELCNRWMSLGAFVPFYRNHNVRGAISQEPYVWDSVAVATRTAMAVRYAMLPYWYTLFADASMNGTPPVRALLWEFPDEGELLSVDLQFLIGANILVSPVTHPNVSYVDAILPGRDKVAWRDWYTHKEVSVAPGATSIRLDAPLGHTPVHIRSGSVLLLHAHPAYTTATTRSGSYELLISLDSAGAASGRVYFDDGISPPPTANRTVHFSAVGGGALELRSQGSFVVEQVVERIVVLGVKSRPAKVSVRGDKKGVYTFEEAVGRLNITGLALSLNADVKVRWA